MSLRTDKIYKTFDGIPIWVTAKQRRIRITDMDDNHLGNALAMLERKGICHDWQVYLQKEVDRRNTKSDKRVGWYCDCESNNAIGAYVNRCHRCGAIHPLLRKDIADPDTDIALTTATNDYTDTIEMQKSFFNNIISQAFPSPATSPKIEPATEQQSALHRWLTKPLTIRWLRKLEGKVLDLL